jgi:hypothetical protein
VSPSPKYISPVQCKAARALLNWSENRLSGEAEIDTAAVRRFEGGDESVPEEMQRAIIRTFESFDVEFINDGFQGVALKGLGSVKIRKSVVHGRA